MEARAIFGAATETWEDWRREVLEDENSQREAMLVGNYFAERIHGVRWHRKVDADLLHD